MVQQNGTKWLEEWGRDWTHKMPISIADNDVFAIDATSSIKKPDLMKPAFNRDAIISTVSGVGTVLFNSAFNDDKQHLIVAGIEARNIITLEHKLKGDFVENRLSIIDFSNIKRPEKYFINLDDMANSDKNSTSGLAMPSAVYSHENTIYFTTLGGNKISHVAYKLRDSLIDSSLTIEKTKHYFLGKEAYSPEPKGGPIGLLASSKRDKVYVQNLFDHSVTEFAFNIDDSSFTETASAQLFNPETPDIASGRQYLYDATLTSSKGNVACATCHIFGEDDKLQWDLSRISKPIEINLLPFVEHPDKDIPDLRTTARPITYKANPNTLSEGDNIVLGGTDVKIVHIGTQKGFADKLASGEIDPKQSSIAYLMKSELDKRLFKYNIRNNKPTWVLIDTPFFHPLKGPMRTLPLKGIQQSGAMHFIGDLQGMKGPGNTKCPEGKTLEERAFKEFNTPCDGSNGAFHNLLDSTALPDTAMSQLTAYSLALDYPPNPIRALDNSTNENGRKHFFRRIAVDVGNLEYVIKREPLIFACIDCHHIDRQKGLYGTSAKSYSAPALTLQDAKIPHLRFLYDRIGYFLDDYRNASYYRNIRKPESYYDELITALGFNHGATFDSTMFFTSRIWVLDGTDKERERPETLKMYEELFDFIMSFESDYYPMFAQQITYNADELMEPETRDNLLAFVDNAYKPENTNTPQCHIYYTNDEHSNSMLFAPEAQVSEFRKDKLLSKLSAIGSQQAVTLTCL
ncbi:MAG: hypothetical protein DRQ59_07455 [Gammaproteobacteria bacterium]|nr:MAG: hypothetical protein DRQ59_07455 [Gammaproteobacteria bacterium]